MPKFFRFPWASTGDKTAIPDATDVAGFVSYQQGYGNDYARDPATDPLAKLIERDKMNQLYSDLTENVQYWQVHTFPEYITAAQNGGVAYAYDIGVIVRYNDGGGFKNYQNETAANTNLPTGAGWVEFKIEAIIHAATSKTTPVDADEFGLVDSAASFVLKKLTWANLKATLLSSLGVMINSLTGKTILVDADQFVIADSAATNATKKVLFSDVYKSIPSGTFTPTLTIGSNLDTLTTAVMIYSRVGNVVSCFGAATIDATTAGSFSFTATLPIATANFADTLGASGVFSNNVTATTTEASGVVRSTPAAQTVTFDGYSAGTASVAIRYAFQYVIQ